MKYIAAALAVVVIIAPQVSFAADKLDFKLQKIYDKCEAINGSHADYANCLYASSEKVIAKMSSGILCSADTCLVKVPCKKEKTGNKCQGGGFKIDYTWNDSGYDIDITLASGKKAHYSQCGSCSDMEPNSDNEIDMRLLGTEKVNLLEFPAADQ